MVNHKTKELELKEAFKIIQSNILISIEEMRVRDMKSLTYYLLDSGRAQDYLLSLQLVV